MICRGKKNKTMLPKCDMTESSCKTKLCFAGIARNLRRSPRCLPTWYYDLSEPACKCRSPKPRQNSDFFLGKNPFMASKLRIMPHRKQQSLAVIFRGHANEALPGSSRPKGRVFPGSCSCTLLKSCTQLKRRGC
jgi:hypothetical protein